MSVDPFHPPPFMRNVETSRRLQANGLLPTWKGVFNAQGISIKPTTINNSDGAIADTVALMSTHAREAAGSSQVRNALQQAGCLQSGLTEEEVINRVFNYVHSNVRFVEDDRQLEQMFAHPTTSQELLITPPVLLSMPQPKGDCDDFSMLVCSMLMAKGVQCDFVTIAANSSQPKEFSHVYCLARTRDGRSIPVDASHGTEAGWETSRQFRKQVWPVFSSTIESRGVGMGRLKFTSPAITKGDSHVHSYLAGLGRVIEGLGVTCTSNDQGDIVCDDGTQSIAGDTSGAVFNPPVYAPLASSPNYMPILSQLTNIFGKIATQVTQPAGVQQTVCNAQGICSSSSTVLPQGATSINVPGISAFNTGSVSGLLPWLIGGLVLFGVIKAASK